MNLLKSSYSKPWVWSFVAAFATWLACVLWADGRGAVDLVRIACTFAAFTSLVSFGQMLVITSGPGQIDLSIPSVIVMASTISMVVMNGEDRLIFAGLAAALAASLVVGAVNHGLIRFIGIPPIIATLASGLIVMSVATSIGRDSKISPPEMFAAAVNFKLAAGFPLVGLFTIIVGVVIALMLVRSRYGRALGAVGQNERAARFSGIDVQRVRLITYAASALLAGVTGTLIAGYAGGNSLDQGAEYLLQTVAVVVIGGTLVTGGRASTAGIIGASLFMFFLVALLNTTGANAGVRTLLTGGVIMLVTTLVGNRNG
ncbi:ABC transporter permease [Mesorhizobium sp. M1D.F.Ca.ET.043.01.1.1]|uniref:ABC transporter permease n=1 Tax=Mesorhizobium sp. M1D.F.Ca.ET.043.01.1.1 TaxID=2493669 RepID=UPI000F74C2E3|nr:ABC transporter permease [Mesorhizobium sp. M1D.F.Ca.ET.043.01.1.1]AZO75637.1 ABC transporter permease [Mesorhizobium sp. M1D.F.Ca.ET.043.01.1.1]